MINYYCFHFYQNKISYCCCCYYSCLVLFVSTISNTKAYYPSFPQNSENYNQNNTRKEWKTFFGKTNLKVLFCHVIQIVSVLKVS